MMASKRAVRDMDRVMQSGWGEQESEIIKRRLTTDEMKRWEKLVGLNRQNHRAWAETTASFDLWTDELLVWVGKDNDPDEDQSLEKLFWVIRRRFGMAQCKVVGMKNAQHENSKRKQGKDPCGIQGEKCNDVVETQKDKERKIEAFVPFVKH